MPIYEYVCRACGQETERLQKLSEPDLVECPHCGKPKLQRNISAAGFRLSGSGWYETDFKKDGRRNLAGEPDAGANTSKSASDGNTGGKNADSVKSESKTESKTSSKAETKSKSKPEKKSNKAGADK